MKKQTYPLFISFLLLLNACSNKPPVPININDMPKPDLDGEMVVVEGYMRLPTYTMGGGSFELHPRLKSRGFSISVFPNHGKEKNQMESLPAEYSNEDLKLHTDNGELLTKKDFVRITGEYDYNEKSNDFDVIKVVKIERGTPPTEDFSKMTLPELTTATLESLHNHPVSVQGMLLVPDTFYARGGGSNLYLQTDKITGPVKLNFLYAADAYPNATLKLFADDDKEVVTVYDADKIPVDLAKEVTLYGTWIYGDPYRTYKELRVEYVKPQ